MTSFILVHLVMPSPEPVSVREANSGYISYVLHIYVRYQKLLCTSQSKFTEFTKQKCIARPLWKEETVHFLVFILLYFKTFESSYLQGDEGAIS